MRSRARAASVALATALAVAAAACGGGDEDTSRSDDSTANEDDSSTTEVDSTTTTLSPEDQAWADLEAGSEAFSAVAADPDPEAPELVRYFTGDSLAGVQGLMRDLQAGTGGSINSVELHRYSVTVVGRTATVDYCFVDSSQHLDTAGNPSGPPSESSMRSTAQMELIDGVWKLAQENLTPEECPAG